MKKLIFILILLFASNAWAVTERLKTICPSACNYTSLQSAIVGEADDLVTDDVYLSLEIGGTWSSPDTTAVSISGYTTDSTHYINIYTTSSARHKGVLSSSYYTLYPSTTGSAIISAQTGLYVRITGLQIKKRGVQFSGSGAGITVDQASNDWRISENIITLGSSINNNDAMGGISVYGPNPSNTSRIWNNIIYGFKKGSGGTNCYGIAASSNFVNIFVYNNTVYNNDVGLVLGGTSTVTSVKARNNIANGNTVDYSVSGDGLVASEKNISEDTTSPNVSYQSKAVTFINETSGSEDLHLDSTDIYAKNAGANLSTNSNLSFSDDVDGETRSGTWDIGADEIYVPPPTRIIYIH